MRNLAILLALLNTAAHAQLLDIENRFANGDVADAVEVNNNFSEIEQHLNSVVRQYTTKKNVAVGQSALLLSGLENAGSDNTAVGYFSSLTNQTGTGNTSVGSYSLGANITGGYNSAVGYNALRKNSDGSHNVALGYYAGYERTGGVRSVAIGNYALQKAVQANEDTAIGYSALRNSNRALGNLASNTAVGAYALSEATTAAGNVAVGLNGLRFLSTGDSNTAVGNGALSNIDGTGNTAIGGGAGTRAYSGNSNTFIGSGSGEQSGERQATGSNNTAVGAFAGYDLCDTSGNTLIGYAADVRSCSVNNSVAIGQNAEVRTSDTIQLGYGIQEVRTSGTFIGAGFQNTSDARLKEAITPLQAGLAIVNDLNPVSYHRIGNTKSDIELGLLAQEVEAALVQHGLANAGTVNQPEGEDYKYLRYHDLLAPIIKAIQELDAQHSAAINEKNAEIAALNRQLKAQQAELLVLSHSQQNQLDKQQQQIATLQTLLREQFAAR